MSDNGMFLRTELLDYISYYELLEDYLRYLFNTT